MCKFSDWSEFKMTHKKSVISDSLFLRFMNSSITREKRQNVDYCKDFIVVKFQYNTKYKYAIEIKSNPTNEKGKGSAIFLHCSKNKPTAGCVAIECSKMQEVINQIDNNTIIIIFGNKNN